MLEYMSCNFPCGTIPDCDEHCPHMNSYDSNDMDHYVGDRVYRQDPPASDILRAIRSSESPYHCIWSKRRKLKISDYLFSSFNRRFEKFYLPDTMPGTRRESRLEKYIKDYVSDKTAEPVYLFLREAISVEHVSKKGSIVVAILWANVLQHPLNYPRKEFPYQKLYDSSTRGDILIVRADGILFTVIMRTGSIIMEGRNVYDWFPNKFKQLLDNYDSSFKETWTFIPSTLHRVKQWPELEPLNDPNTELEDYLLMRTTRQGADYDAFSKHLPEPEDELVEALGNMSSSSEIIAGPALDDELKTLASGKVCDGLSRVYCLWKSLLNKWLGEYGLQVYVSTPQLDTPRLLDILSMCVQHKNKGTLEAFHVKYECDSTNGKTISQVKHEALAKFSPRQQTFLEYTVLHRMMYPVKPLAAIFIAGIREDEAEVLLTSTGFHGDNFLHERSQNVVFLRMHKQEFLDQYIQPIGPPFIATCY